MSQGESTPTIQLHELAADRLRDDIDAAVDAMELTSERSVGWTHRRFRCSLTAEDHEIIFRMQLRIAKRRTTCVTGALLGWLRSMS
jgi:hypothetical protein